jgi:hypothetical protein
MKRFQDLSPQARCVALLSVETVPQCPAFTTKFVRARSLMWRPFFSQVSAGAKMLAFLKAFSGLAKR